MKKVGSMLIFVMLLAACDSIPMVDASTSDGGKIADCRTVVGSMAALQNGLGIPQYFLMENPVKQGGEFDAMQYFVALDRLSLQPGYTLDYVYHYDGMGGYPVLYAYPDSQLPYATEADLAAASGKTDYLNYINVEDNAEGYFQFALLAAKGGQFYLDWHANYNDIQIVCDRTDMRDIVAGLDGSFGYRMPLVSRLRAFLLWEVTPRVIIGEQTVEVRLVTFTKWGGFYLTTYTISRSSPPVIQDFQEKNLVPYECGVMF